MKRFVFSTFWLIFGVVWSGYGQQPSIIYVTPNGTGPGTQANPANLTTALQNAGPGKQIRLAAGTYYLSQTIQLAQGVTIEGGYNSTTWCKSNTLKTRIYRDSANILSNPNRLVAFSAENISDFHIHDLEIITANAEGDGVTNYGIYINNCSNYSIVRCKIKAGNGSNGSNGLPGTNGQNGANGQQGGQGDGNGPCCTQGGLGGSSWSGGAYKGGNGGNGGAQGSFNSCPNGQPGQPGSGPGGGAGGLGGLGSCNFISFGCDAGPANHGQPGQPGADGANGAPGADGVPGFANGFFIPGDGQNGQPGQPGSGGGGGGGGGSQGGQPHINVWFVNINNNGAGPGGGGGGEGGQGGSGGGGGKGGGGSFGVFGWNNGPNAKLIDCTISSGLPGQGGLGNPQGGLGGLGGLGDPTNVAYDCDLGNPGPGGNGGKGGNGGPGGNGAPGLSYAIYEDPGGEPFVQTTMASPVEPQVTVCELGCTYAETNLSTNAVGFVQWFFDGGTVPAVATGNNVTVYFTTPGRHTFVLVVNGLPYIFSEYIGVFEDGLPYMPQIIPDTSEVCPGATVQFSSSYAGLSYDWTFPGGNPASLNGPGLQTVSSTYANTGIYPVSLKTLSQECGWSIRDTAVVKVLPTLQPSVLVSAASSGVCFGQSLTMGAAPTNGGDNPTYAWSVNGQPAGTGPVLTLNNITSPQTVTVTMTSSYACPVPNPVSSLPFQITVNPLPVVNCSYNGTYLGLPTSFSVNVNNGTSPYTFFWEFGDGSGISSQQNPSYIYPGTGGYTATLLVTDANGCTASCTLPLVITVAPDVNAQGSATVTSIGCGTATVSFTDQSGGNPTGWFWDFGDGTSSTQQNPTHTYTQPGLYSVMLVANNGVNYDTTWLPNVVNIPPYPVAGIDAVKTVGCEPFKVQFQDASSGATTWLWDFGDGSPQSSLQNPYHTYTQAGTYTVTLTVTNSETGCSDTHTETAFIQVLQAPDVNFTVSDSVVCAHDVVQFFDLSTNGPVTSWLWDFGDGTTSTQQNPSHAYNTPAGGGYWVTLTVTGPGPAYCPATLTKSHYIVVNVKPTAAFSPTNTVLELPDNKVRFINYSWGYDNVLWNFNTGSPSTALNPVVTFPDSGYYPIWLYAFTNEGCSDTAYGEVLVLEQQVVYIPNTFTPDGDYLNEVFTVKGKGIKELEILIYDRWGEKIYHGKGLDAGWNGRRNNVGSPCPQGVYTYKVLVEYYTGKNVQFVGHISLLR